MTEISEGTDQELVPKECSQLQLCCVWAFFIALTGLAIYVMIAFPQTEF
jgi:hypothetical protein